MLKTILCCGGKGGWGGGIFLFFKNLFRWVMLRMQTEFQCPTKPGTGGAEGTHPPHHQFQAIIVFSLSSS